MQRHVVSGSGAMAWRSGCRKPQPKRRLFGHTHAVNSRVAVFSDTNAAAFVKHHADIVEQVGMFRQEVSSSERATGFFVSSPKKDHIAFQSDFVPLERQQRREFHDRRPFVVQRAAAPNHTVFELAAKWFFLPEFFIRWNNIHMIEQNYRFSRAISAENGIKISAAGRGFDDSRFNALTIKNAFEEFGRLDLVAGWICRVYLNIPAQK